MIPELTLEQACQHYWQEVPWTLDEDDLRIINKVRRLFHEEHGTLCIHTTELQDWLRSPRNLSGRIAGSLWNHALKK